MIDRNQVKVGQVAAQLETVALRNGEVAGLGQAGRQLAAEEVKKRWNAADELGKILAQKTLEADRLAGARGMFSGQTGKRLDIPKHVPARKVGSRSGVLDRGLNHLHHAAVDDVEAVAGVAGGINGVAFPQMADPGELADCLQLQEPQARAIGKEILIEHGSLPIEQELCFPGDGLPSGR